ncbi:MAG: ABC transporter ATP-binding protein [Bacillota bacterium]|nr:ABC transporter ATP-binding protein [Bacillota bacterium]
MEEQAVIRLEELSKSYGPVRAVDRLSFEVRRGELVGFLGPNGAGKTTTLRMLAGLLEPSGGRALVAGFDVWRQPLEAKRRLGYVPDVPVLYEKLSGREFLAFVGELWSVPEAVAGRRARELLELFGLAGQADDPVQSYSRGMRQKLAIAGALLHDPAALVLDEPTIGLDPRSARLLKNVLRDFCRRGGAVLMSTHVLEIAQHLCDRVVILQNGRLLAQGSPEELARGADRSLEDVFIELTGGEEVADLVRLLGEEERG